MSGAAPARPVVEVLEASYIASAMDVDGLPAPMFAEVAFGGRSNVGKSSLINTLLARRKLVRTSSTPGATRGISVFRAQLRIPEGEATLDLVDLPGYGFAQRSKKERRSWGPMIEGFIEHRVGLRAVVLIVDVRRGLEEDDAQLIEYLEHVGRECIVVATKIDKLPSSKRKLEIDAVRKAAGVPLIGMSSETGEGREVLWDRVLRAAGVRAAK